MTKEKYIDVVWTDLDTGDIIFQETVLVEDFKKAHRVSPHEKEGGGHHDVLIKTDL